MYFQLNTWTQRNFHAIELLDCIYRRLQSIQPDLHKLKQKIHGNLILMNFYNSILKFLINLMLQLL